MIKTRADLFEAAAKMMRMCDEAKHCYVYKLDGILYRGLTNDAFAWQPDRYEFPLAFVEGKPVFVGDTLYDHNPFFSGNTKFIVSERNRDNLADTCSWNPPKPRTVMVELLR